MKRETPQRRFRQGWDKALTEKAKSGGTLQTPGLIVRPKGRASIPSTYALRKPRKPRRMLTAAVVAIALVIFGTGGVGIAKFASYGSVATELAPMPAPDLTPDSSDLKKAEALSQQKKQDDARPKAGTSQQRAASEDKRIQDSPHIEKPIRKEAVTPDKPGPATAADSDADTPDDMDTTTGVTRPGGVDPLTMPIRLSFSDSGFSTPNLTVNAGDTVIFVNESTADFQPVADDASGNGPYPDFDPGAAIAPGETWNFVFSQPGTWSFHDALNPANSSTITVN